ncbi:MAG: ribonuclease J [Anaerolineae bacterium]
MTESLRIIPLGGLGEIGKNMMLFEYGSDILVVDAGVMFPANDMLGVDLVLPDWNYLRDKVQRIIGIVITHGHEDHIGALPYLIRDLNLTVPIFGTRMVQGLVEDKLREAKLYRQCPQITIDEGDIFPVGPFDLEFISVTHSIPDGVAVAIRTPIGMALHTGDFKFDTTPVQGVGPDFGRLAELGKEGVMVLLADSTGAERPGWTPTETNVRAAFDQIFRNAQGRIIVSTFASLLSRIQLIIDTAYIYKRKVALAGYSMHQYVKIARKLNHLEVPRGVLIDLDKIDGVTPDKLVIITTGAQGQPEAGLSRIASGRHREIEIIPGDTVVLSSNPIPGNEQVVSAMINRLIRRGAEVIYPPLANVHVSGHASQEEMKLLLALTKPEYFIPVHGELRHLHAHARLAREMGIPEDYILTVENGTVLEFDEAGAMVGERLPGGYVFVAGSSVGDVGPSVLRDRESLSSNGVVSVAFKWNYTLREIVGTPEITSRGFVYEREAGDLMTGALERITQALRETNRVGKRGLDEAVKEALGRYFYDRVGRRPMVITAILDA